MAGSDPTPADLRGSPAEGVAVIGAGPAGLIAAECMARHGLPVTVYDRMPTAGRKLLMAGRGGLNLTHSEPLGRFLGHYGTARPRLEPMIRAFPPEALRAWCEGLGQETFVGSSGRVFPKAMKASPLLRAWLARLAGQGVRFRLRQRWTGWTADGALSVQDHEGNEAAHRAAATVFALGGASWPRLGSDAAWVPLLREHGITVDPLGPANVGVEVAWTTHLRDRFAGAPLKRIAVRAGETVVRGECVITGYGLEGGAIYGVGPMLRGALERDAEAVIHLDLRPDAKAETLAAALGGPRGKRSLSNHLRKSIRLEPAAIALLHEGRSSGPPREAMELARLIKSVPITVTGLRPLAEAISTAGGVSWEELDRCGMLLKRPGTFLAGEMLDWEAPTGGYLLQACFATGLAAGEGAIAWLAGREPAGAACEHAAPASPGRLAFGD